VTSTGGDPGAAARAELVAQLRRRGTLSEPRVAAALGQVPRHVFLPEVDLPGAYADEAVPTLYRDGVPVSAASQPAIVAIMLEQLRPPRGGRVLEIGAGTGYNAALLSHLVGPSGRVVTIDIDPDVAAGARAHLAGAGITNVTVICGDGAAGRAEDAPYDGIIVTAGASDLAPAWAGQLAPAGRLVVPLSIRGVQHCVSFTRDGGRLRSTAVCECGFMPLAGAMANADRRLPVPGHPGVFVLTAPDTEVDTAVVAAALGRPGPAAATGLTASVRETFGSLPRWLAFREPASASLAYLRPPEDAAASGVPSVLDSPLRSALQRSAPCLLGTTGFAVLDLARPPGAGTDPGPDPVLELAVRSYGEAQLQRDRLAELIAAWAAAGRPQASHLRIHAYPAGSAPSAAEGFVHRAPHTTFVVSLR
jgi:protein-L-isoaspartate(D-aspartate) O-methyltransferase